MKPGNTVILLYDDAAIDVSRITGIPWSYQQLESRSKRRPCINLLELDSLDRLRVVLTVAAVELLLGVNNGITRTNHGVAATRCSIPRTEIGVLHVG